MAPCVLVTGGAGFIGSHLVSALLAEGYAVRVLDNLSTGRLENLAEVLHRIDFRRGDVREAALVAELCRGVDFVLHQASLVSVPASIADPGATYEIIARGTLNVLEAARAAGVKRVVLASSSAVYGDAPGGPRAETLAPRPLSPYAAAKLAAEALGRAYYHSYGLETVSLRYFNVYGPRQDPNSPYAAVIPSFIAALADGRRPVIFGNGEQTRDFIHVFDVVRANLLAMTAPGVGGETVNIGTGRGVSVNQLLREIASLFGVPPAAEYAPPRPGDIRASVAETLRARRLLGFVPEIGLRQGLADLLASWPRARTP
ncbi:MAG: NAD-dependent epimerase/dehydratase family protein [Bacillota bacterium]